MEERERVVIFLMKIIFFKAFFCIPGLTVIIIDILGDINDFA